MENLNKNELKQNMIRIGKGSVISILITLALLFLFSIILTFTTVNENTIMPVVIIITSVSILIGSSISTLKIKKKGMINGGIVGLIYIVTIYVLSSISGAGFSLGLNSIIMAISAIIAGMIGGIIGVNL